MCFVLDESQEKDYNTPHKLYNILHSTCKGKYRAVWLF